MVVCNIVRVLPVWINNGARNRTIDIIEIHDSFPFLSVGDHRLNCQGFAISVFP